ncbi:MAG TPA: flagellar hook-basal body complex protein [Chloroflexota bacterium]|jgi:flagellar hook protein FlgE|nr:flagellar hook-basal body complex protein [Chloroflexota bacterium]
MMRSLFSAVSGMRSHQTLMDVVGNNIANVNTVAFKSARVNFQDLISQTVRQAAPPNPPVGGANPVQVGLGVQLGSIDLLMAQGNLQATGRTTDLAIQGDGWFVLSNGASTPTISFTRDGNFDLAVPDSSGNRALVHTSSGLLVLGYTSGVPVTADSTTAPQPITIPQTQGGVAVTGFSIAPNGVISLVLADGTSVPNYAQIALAKFANDGGLQRAGSNLFLPTVNSGQPVYNGAAANGRGEVKSGFLEMSNVDLATQFTNMILAQRGFQSNSRVITATDEILQDLVNIKR